MIGSQKQELITWLKEIRCDEAQSDRIAECILAGETETALLLLRRHRRTLMDALHESEKRVDQLDLLVYRMEKDKSEKDGNGNGRTQINAGMG